VIHLLTEDGRVVRLQESGTWAYAPTDQSGVAKMRLHPVRPAVVDAVQGLFTALGMRVVETGEVFTCYHRGDRLEFVEGLDESSVDFTVPVYLFQLDRVAEFLEDGVLDEVELFRITDMLFLHGFGRRHLSANPLVSNPVLRFIIGGKSLLHITMLSPDLGKAQHAKYTMAFANRQWLVVTGHHGRPQRVMTVRVSDALEIQRQFNHGMRRGSLGVWVKIARWYVEWRRRVEVMPTAN
jgi:hypothetical protein